MNNACDSHVHVLDPAFATVDGQGVPTGMTASDYEAVQPVLGTDRVVIVQAKNYGTDNRCLVDALARFSPRARGVAVVDRRIGDDELVRLHKAGVRGVRFSLWNPTNAVVDAVDLMPVAERIAPLGWHLQLHMSADQLVAHRAELARLPCDLVIDHMARLPSGRGCLTHPAFDLVRGLANDGHAWVKLSGPYLNRRPGAAGFDDARAVARAWVEAIANRLVWGSDWPHVTEGAEAPAPETIAATLHDWCAGDPRLIETIAVHTPAALYGFGTPA
ncbi:amidohydrolase family protein [Salinisphaera sp. T31B1]|uniref:amidohydrolase family protein n=1 Tax=Salinisphaera sp. T31B1 TaxID=727963 RepID=UPI00334226E9